jgi:hypothetical protein
MIEMGLECYNPMKNSLLTSLVGHENTLCSGGGGGGFVFRTRPRYFEPNTVRAANLARAARHVHVGQMMPPLDTGA